MAELHELEQYVEKNAVLRIALHIEELENLLVGYQQRMARTKSAEQKTADQLLISKSELQLALFKEIERKVGPHLKVRTLRRLVEETNTLKSLDACTTYQGSLDAEEVNALCKKFVEELVGELVQTIPEGILTEDVSDADKLHTILADTQGQKRAAIQRTLLDEGNEHIRTALYVSRVRFNVIKTMMSKLIPTAPDTTQSSDEAPPGN